MKKRRSAQQEYQEVGGGNLLTDILTFPVLGIPRMLYWVARKVAETAEQEENDEGRLRGELLELQMRHELEEIDDDEYDEQETALLDRLSTIRRAKEEE